MQMMHRASAAGKITRLKELWDYINKEGPKYGYFPNSSKTILIVKGSENLPKANAIFGQTEVKITTEGERHLGAVIGSSDFKNTYVSTKVSGWIKNIEQLSIVAIKKNLM